MVTDYTGRHQTFLHVREINIKAYALVILNQIIQPDQNLNPRPTGNLLKYIKPLGQAWISLIMLHAIFKMFWVFLGCKFDLSVTGWKRLFP